MSKRSRPIYTHEWAGSVAASPFGSLRFMLCAPPAPRHSPSLSTYSPSLARPLGAETAAPAALAFLPVRLHLVATLGHLLDVGIVQLLVFRRQRRADFGLLALAELGQLVERRLVLRECRPRRSRVALLACGPRFLHRRLHLLTQRLGLRRVLAVDVLDLRLLGVAQLDSTEQATLDARTGAHAALHLMATLLSALLRGSLGSGERSDGHERRERECDYTSLTHASSKVLERSNALPDRKTPPASSC